LLRVYEELGDQSRRDILVALQGGPKNVGDLVAATGLKQPNVSNHLRRLRERGIVEANKVGREVFYRLASPSFESVLVQARETPSVASTLDYEAMAKEYAKSAIGGDEAACTELVDRALTAQASLIDIYQELLTPGMALVGTWYKVQAIDEAEEHMASAITERMLGRTMQLSPPIGRSGRIAVLGCAPNAHHVIGLRMIGDFLRLSGWKTLFLGANVPQTSFLAAVRQHQPELVLISCASEESASSTLDLLRALRGAKGKRRHFTVGVGGLAVRESPDRFLRAGADFTANDLRSFAQEFLPRFEGKHE
jgi:methanogenic corrinoid protein MtbC1